MFTFPQLLLLWMAFFMLAIWLPALFAPKKFISILDKTLKNSDIVRVWAIITMIIGFLFLTVYQKFDNWRAMLFSIFGYLSLIKWLFLLRFPTWAYTKYKKFYAKPIGSMIIWIFVLLFAAFTVWVALMKI